MKNIIIIGSSGHAKVIIDIIEQEKKYNIIGLIDTFRKAGEITLGYSILGQEEDLPKIIEKYLVSGAIVAIGDNFLRSAIVEKIKKIAPNLLFISSIHPKASIGKDVSIGEGTVIMPGVCINSSSFVGKFCILNTNASLDHDSTLEDFASIGPGVKTGGYCHISSYSAIGIGATLVQKTHIGEHTVIGANSLVMKNIRSFSIAYGSPAKIIRSREKGEKYL